MSSEEESDTNNSSYDLLYDSIGDNNKPAVQLQQLLKKQQFGICNNILNNSSALEQQRISARQRVDAGEPRNSYSSIPNFSSRSAAFMNGGLYGAIFSQHQNNSGASTAVQQQQQAANFGSLFGPSGYGPAKMLNDLLQGRTQLVKQENLMISPNNLNNNIGNGSEQSLLSANNIQNNIIDGQATLLKDSSSENNSCNNNSVVTPNNLVNNCPNMDTSGLMLDEATAQATNDLAHHMLRNILQGKKELQLALDQELRKANAQSGSGNGSERNSPDNNNTILNKNNNLTNNNNYDKSAENALSPNNIVNNNSTTTITADNLNNQSDVNNKSSENNNSSKNINNTKNNDTDDKNKNNNSDDANSNKENNNRDTNIPMPKQEEIDLNDEDMEINCIPELENSLDSHMSNQATDGKDDIMDSDKGDSSPSPILSNSKPELDLKRARVENIVSSMRASPSAQVNGCKKRKLYHPQQHDNSTMMERYAAAAVGLNLGLNLHSFMLNNSTGPESVDDEDDENGEPHDIHRKLAEKTLLKSQLKSMQDQLAEMQQKYIQLCNRMDQTSDTPDIDENSSDIVEDDMNNEALNKRTSPLTKLPMESPVKDLPQKSTPPTPNNLSQLMSKMMSAKIQGHLPPHLSHQFNGQIPFLQHLQQQQAMHDAAANMQQGGHENPASLHAAAMYQKLIMEQHARRAKEVADQQQQELLNQQREQQAQVQQQQQQQQIQQNNNNSNAQNNMGQNMQNPNQKPNSQSPNQNQGPPQGQNPNGQLSKVPSELAERLKKTLLKSQLKSMQDQLAEMQQKYIQLCNRMDQTSDTPDIDENSSDIVEDDMNNEALNKRTSPLTKLPMESPVKDLPQKSTPPTPNNLSQLMSKMMSAKIQGHLPPHLSHQFNGQIPFLQHLQQQQAMHDAAANMQQGGHENPASLHAAAMYQKLIMEQHARRAKEVADQQQQELLNQQREQQAQVQQQQQQQQIQQNNNNSNAQNNMGQNMQNPNQKPNSQSPNQNQGPPQGQNPNGQLSKVPSELAERLSMMRNNNIPSISGHDLEGLAEVLKQEISTSLTNLVDTIVSRFMQQRKFLGKASERAVAATEQFSKDLMLASQLLDRKSPRSKVQDRNSNAGNTGSNQNSAAAMFQPPKPPQGMSPVTAAALYNSMANLGNPNNPNPFCLPEPRETTREEQNEALSLVVTPKKKRHKVTDTRITPRTVSRILAQDGIGASTNYIANDSNSQNNGNKQMNSNAPTPTSQAPSQVPSESPSPRQKYHPPTSSILPVSLPTSVAIPNPSLHESKVFSPYSPFFNPHGPQPSQLHHMHHMSASPPGLGNMMDPRDSPPLPHPQTMLHPALLAAAHHGNSPDYSHIRAAMDANDRNSDCNSGELSYDGMQPTISFSKNQLTYNRLIKQTQDLLLKEQQSQNNLNEHESITPVYSSTLTPMHLRKAKLMFFWVRYPSSAVLKMYFPDIKFNKNNTAQLVKWFSNFREFYYIQMEKYARQAVSEGVKSVDDIHITLDSEIYRVPPNFRYVIEQTLKEFFRAIQSGKDTEQSWKKSIYKIISRLDDQVPEYFKSPNFLEQLE
uniref:CSON006339 protein n=1 Tax=Culicoides sonorensis TaxID=179676 RepID=A0A336MW69_CULSO